MAKHLQAFLTALAALALLVLAGAPTALMQTDEVARIDSPVAGASVVGTVEVRGRAMTADRSKFSFYRLHYGAGSAPSSLRPIGNPVDQPVENGVLGVWDTAPLITGEYTVQLTVYDTSGGTTITRVLVTVLPAPTPTPLLQQPVRVPVPGETPTPSDEDTGPTPTPLPEIAPLVPNIPQIDTSPINPSVPVQPVQGPESGPGFQPIPINTGPTGPQVGPFNPGGPVDSAPTFDTGIPSSPPLNPINPINAPGAPSGPNIAPYEPPPTFAPPAIPTPTIFGL
ncbi:MAG: hypothetical protein IT306_02390 [Chloroflexi bacterium]|nr:hypothetical protein [Chloroflexota bacterium]